MFALALGAAVELSGVAHEEMPHFVSALRLVALASIHCAAITNDLAKTHAGMQRLSRIYGEQLAIDAGTKLGSNDFVSIAENAGVYGGVALRLLASHGREALAVSQDLEALEVIDDQGPVAEAAYLRHGSVATALVRVFGPECVSWLARISASNGQRMAKLAADGVLDAELVRIVELDGDGGCDFLWQNRSTLKDGAMKLAFLQAPVAFLNGEQKLPRSYKPLGKDYSITIGGHTVDQRYLAIIPASIMVLLVLHAKRHRLQSWFPRREIQEHSGREEVGHDG